MKQNTQKWIDFNEKKKQMFALLDEYTEHRYTQTIQKRVEKNEFYLLLQVEDYEHVFDKKYKLFFKELSFRTKLSVMIKARFPWIVNVLQKAKV